MMNAKTLWDNGGMDRFLIYLRQKIWTAIVLLIGSWIPWLIGKFATDAFKQTIRNFAQSSDVTAGMYSLMSIAAQNPVAASLLTVLVVVSGAAIYSAVQVSRHASTPRNESEDTRDNQENTALKAKVTKLEASVTEFQKREDVVVRRETALEQTEKQITEHVRIDTFWNIVRRFKDRAREIRRTWPNAEFNKRPMFLHSWIPPLHSPAPPWLRLATEWREGMIKLPYISMHSDERLNAMDFDEVIELLDDADADSRGIKPFRTINVGGLPDVEITRWGARDESETGSYKFGFFLRNVGDAASQVSISPLLRLGDLVLSSGRLPLLLKQHNDVFLPCFLDRITGGGIIPINLSELISGLPANENGVRLAPRVRIAYRTANGSWIASTYELHSGSNKTVSVSFLKRELLVTTTPQLDIVDSLERQSPQSTTHEN